MTLIEYIPIIISIITYAIVFVIQKSLYTKQNDLMNSYKEVLKIMSLDEIKKHVALKEENLILNYENREKKIEKIQNVTEEKLEMAEKVLLDSENMNIELKNLFDDKVEANILMVKTNKFIDDRKNIDIKMLELYQEEFNKIYDFINKDLKSTDEFKGLCFEKNLLVIRTEYMLKRTELLEKREPLN